MMFLLNTQQSQRINLLTELCINIKYFLVGVRPMQYLEYTSTKRVCYFSEIHIQVDLLHFTRQPYACVSMCQVMLWSQPQHLQRVMV